MAFRSILFTVALAGLMTACAQPSLTQHADPGRALAGSAPSAAADSRIDAAALMAHDWRLSAATDRMGGDIPALQPGIDSPLILSFSEHQLNIRGGCNTLFGPYELHASRLRVKNLAGTMMACEPARMRLDQAISARMKADLDIRLEGAAHAPRLILRTADGDELAFAGQRKAASGH